MFYRTLFALLLNTMAETRGNEKPTDKKDGKKETINLLCRIYSNTIL